MTAHCHAAPAQLTREYQGDHRRDVLTPGSELTDVANWAVSPAKRREPDWHDSANSMRNDPSNPADFAHLERDGECSAKPSP